MKLGDYASITKKFTMQDVLGFAKYSEDANPVHFDPEFASKTRFKSCIVQGPMVASLIGGVLGSKLPGTGTIYLAQRTNFLLPVFIDDEVTAHVEVIQIRPDKPIVTLKTWVTNHENKCVLDGEAVVLLEKLQFINRLK